VLEEQRQMFCSTAQYIPSLEEVVQLTQQLDLLLILELKHGVRPTRASFAGPTIP